MVVNNLNPVRNWLKREYPRPDINPDWLQGCCQALQENEPAINTKDLIHAVNLQLLLSSLDDSCVPNTGLPSPDELDDLHGEILFQKEGCLVMVMSVMEVGHSAFQLQTTMENRKEALSGVRRIRRIGNPQADGGEEGEEEEDEDDEAIPPYPRGMLRLELSDGYSTLKAMEYQRINGLTLGETALGSKMLLKGVQLRRGILLLTPANVVLKGHMVEEIEMHQGRLFQNTILRALGKPELPLADDIPMEQEEVENHQQHFQQPGAEDDRFSEYEGDMEYDLIASGIDLAVQEPNRLVQVRLPVEDEDIFPGDDDLEAMMVMQERAQARAQAPIASGSRPKAAHIPQPRMTSDLEEDWEVMEAMEAEEIRESGTALRNDRAPIAPARLTLGLPIKRPPTASSSQAQSSAGDDDSDLPTRSRFFDKGSAAKTPKAKASAQPKPKKKPKLFLSDEEDGTLPPLEYVYDQSEEDEDYVPSAGTSTATRKAKGKGSIQTKRQTRKSKVERKETPHVDYDTVLDIDDDDLEDSQKENRPAFPRSKGSAGRGSGPNADERARRKDQEDEVIEISD